ncbi:MAG: hypothetical protein KatS3mg103_1080 [Phycisphaerales bacterium]|nr:MAG: hypothetical protein KatS3mg103_1080 [Phycisphaerales bacterium]
MAAMAGGGLGHGAFGADLAGVLSAQTGAVRSGVSGGAGLFALLGIGVALLVVLAVVWFLASRVQRRPPNRFLVVWGSAGRTGRKC